MSWVGFIALHIFCHLWCLSRFFFAAFQAYETKNISVYLDVVGFFGRRSFIRSKTIHTERLDLIQLQKRYRAKSISTWSGAFKRTENVPKFIRHLLDVMSKGFVSFSVSSLNVFARARSPARSLSLYPLRDGLLLILIFKMIEPRLVTSQHTHHKYIVCSSRIN